jgi:hypothetical protein
MGCCSHKYTQETLLYNYWTYIPLRKLSIEDYIYEVLKIDEFSKKAYDDLLYRSDFAFNIDEPYQHASKQLFDDLYIKHGPEWVLFSLVFLTKHNHDPSVNMNKLIELSDRLKLRIIEKDNKNYFITEFMLKKLYHCYISIISNNCVEPVFNNYFEDDAEMREYKLQLHSFYREELIDLVINYILENNELVNDHLIILDDFIQNMKNMQEDETIRKLLQEAHENEAKFTVTIVDRPTTSRAGKNKFILFKDEKDSNNEPLTTR